MISLMAGLIVLGTPVIVLNLLCLAMVFMYEEDDSLRVKNIVCGMILLLVLTTTFVVVMYSYVHKVKNHSI